MPEGVRFILLSPLVAKRKGEHRDVIERLRAGGYVRVRIDGEIRDAADERKLDPAQEHTIDAVVDRLVVKEGLRSRLAESLETALKLGEGLAIASIETPHANGNGRIEPMYVDRLVSDRFACARCRTTFPELEPRLFSFNSPEGACPACNGLGTRPELDPELIVPDTDLTLAQGAIEAWKRGGKKLTGYYDRLLADFATRFKANVDVPYRNLSDEMRRILMFGTEPA